ncbi:MAG: hypothetical protein ACO3M5_10910 [Saprospiraceae bacterium]
MIELDKKYKTALDNVKSSIQLSEELKNYLDEEGTEEYKELVSKFENSIHEIYEQVAADNPLQLLSLEKYLLDEQFEGLYLPKVLGYSVLRGRVNENVKYYRPQEHFAEVLEFIINSSNFEQIKQRVGQSIQVGFALSSDIWITNTIDKVTNKRVKSFLSSQKMHRYLDPKIRNSALVKYRKQFQSLNFQTAVFPSDLHEFQLEAESIKDFLIYRAKSDYDNSNILPAINELLSNAKLRESIDMYEICIILGLYYNLDEKGAKLLGEDSTKVREKLDQSGVHFMSFLNAHSDKVNGISQDAERSLASYIDRGVSDILTNYFSVLDKVNSLGYVHEDALAAVREYYYKNEGLSIENEAIRKSILSKLRQFLQNLQPDDYNEYFEINKTFTAYMDIFSNQKFNQDLKDLCLKYVKRCLKQFTDKRGKEYQDIKKFIKASFVDYGFMTEKEVNEIFKTRRKPRS